MFNKVIQILSKPKKNNKEDIYSKEVREQLLDEGALNIEEDGFMEGYGEEEFIDDHEYDDDDDDDDDNDNNHDDKYSWKSENNYESGY